jgi:AraC family transcriptional regulator
MDGYQIIDGRASDHGAHVLPQEVVEIATRLLDSARESLMRDWQEAARCASEAADLLKRESSGELESPTATGALLSWQLKKVQQLFEANVSGSIRVADAAAAVRLSISHFTRAFRRSVGETPCAYLRRLRVHRAQELMLATDDSLAEIAADCGFADQSHLCRVFQGHTRMSPGAWRRMRRGDRSMSH